MLDLDPLAHHNCPAMAFVGTILIILVEAAVVIYRICLGLVFLSLLIGNVSSAADEQTGVVYELRTYTATPGRLDDVLARFRNHTNALLEKHGMKVIGYWTPTDEEKAGNTLIYILHHQNRQAADQSWQKFASDPAWKKVSKESNANGRILADVVREYMVATDFSPMK